MTTFRTWLLATLAILACAAGYAESELAVEPTDVPGEPAAVEPGTSLDLATAQRIALQDNPSIEAAEARIVQARALVKQAQSTYFPTVTFSAGVTKTWLSNNDYQRARNAPLQMMIEQMNAQLSPMASVAGSASGNLVQALAALREALVARSMVDDSFENYTTSIQATWLLFDGFGREFSNAMARYGHKESQASLRDIQRLLLAGVASAFYNVQLQRENVEIAEADVEFFRRQLKEAKARRRVGMGSLSDELNFEVRVRSSESSLITAERLLAVARIGLASLMGIPDASLPEDTHIAALAMETPDELEPPPDSEALISYAMEHRPDVAQADLAVKRSEADVGVQRSVFFPAVSAFAARDTMEDDEFEFNNDAASTTLGLNVSVDLFAGGRNRAAYAEAKARKTEAERNRDSTALAVAQEVQEIATLVKASQHQLVLQRANAEYVQRNRDLVAKGYNAGQESLVRLNEAQRDLVRAQVSLALARASLRDAWYALRVATGETMAAIEAMTGDTSPAGEADSAATTEVEEGE